MANLQFYLDTFRHEWESGKDACLHIECHAGQVWLSFHLRQVAHTPHQQQHQRRHYGPSRLRRRAKRAAERAAANAVSRETQVDGVNTAEKAVQTDDRNNDLSNPSAAEEVAQQPQHPCESHLPAEQAGHCHVRPPDVSDIFCPDHAYEAAAKVARHDVGYQQSHNIPQLDGMNHEEPNSPATFARLSRVMHNKSWHIRADEEDQRRREHEEDLKKIERMIQNHVGL